MSWMSSAVEADVLCERRGLKNFSATIVKLGVAIRPTRRPTIPPEQDPSVPGRMRKMKICAWRDCQDAQRRGAKCGCTRSLEDIYIWL